MNAETRRTLTTVLNAVRPLALAAVLALLAAGHAVAEPGVVEVDMVDPVSEHPALSLEDTARFAGCVSPIPGVLIEQLVVVDHDDRRRHRLSFDRAWALNHDDDQLNDVWVIGHCPGPRPS